MFKKGNNDKKRLKCSKTEKLLNKFSFQLTAGISLSYYMSVTIVKIVLKKNNFFIFLEFLSINAGPASGSELNLKRNVFSIMKV